MLSIEELPLHDALLNSIEINWPARCVEIRLSAFVVKGNDSVPHLLKFEEVTNTHAPHESPWGESLFINEVSVLDGTVTIEMQTGDKLTISAGSYSFEPVAI